MWRGMTLCPHQVGLDRVHRAAPCPQNGHAGERKVCPEEDPHPGGSRDHRQRGPGRELNRVEAVAGIKKQVLGRPVRTGDRGTGAVCGVTHRGRHICRPGSPEVVPAHLCSPAVPLPVTPSGFLCGGSLLRTLAVGIPQPTRNARD